MESSIVSLWAGDSNCAIVEEVFNDVEVAASSSAVCVCVCVCVCV